MFNDLLDLVLPRACFGCGRIGSALCAACAIPELRRPHPGVVAAAAYDGPLRSALIAYKERGRRDLAAPLAALLRAALAEFGPDVALVPIPSSRTAAAQRGGDHVLRLARRCERPIVRALTLRSGVLDSAGLTSLQRRANLADAFCARAAQSAAPPVVLIDDIVTTGATLHEARHALSSAGWDVLGAATVAETPLRWARPKIHRGVVPAKS
jgi:predicted amidophosphoribosyltransferase